ncbi:MAG: redoxin domain-containing protein [Planctomycetota bacterium]|nr:MAG: redoxin domain-containing protein [Planctomycetota bacterium]
MFGNFPNQKPLVGDKAPDFKLEDTKGKKYKLSDFKGKKPVVLEFGALT